MIHKEYDIKTIGANLQRLRCEKNYSVEEIRQYLGLASARTVYYYEAGQRVAPFNIMFALMELYGVDIADLTRKV